MADPTSELVPDAGPGYAAYRQEQAFSRLDAEARARAAGQDRIVLGPDGRYRTLDEEGPGGVGFVERLDRGGDQGRGGETARPDGGGLTDGPIIGTPADTGPSMTGRVLRDMGRGAIESPRAVAGGVTQALQEFSNSLASAGRWLEENIVPLGGLQVFDQDWNFDPKYLSPEEQRGQPNPQVMPKIDMPDSTTGKLIRGVAQFATGFITSKSLTGMSGAASTVGKIAQAQGAGASSMALFHDPDHGNLANAINDFAKEHPWARQPVTEYLAAEKEDSEAENRLKAALVDGLGAGVAVEGLIQGFRLVRSYIRAARAGGEAPVTALDQARAQYGEVKPERDFLILGDPDPRAPLLKVEQPTVAADPLAKIQAAERATETGVPTAVAAEGVVGPANEAKVRARDLLRRTKENAFTSRTLDDMAREDLAEAAADHSGLMEIIKAWRRGVKPPKGLTLTQWLVNKGGVQEFKGELAAIGVTSRARPGLVNRNGMSLDDAAHAAWEDGFFPTASERPDIREFLDALADDFSKRRPVVLEGTVDADAMARWQAVQDLEAAMYQLEVPAGATDAEIIRALERAAEARPAGAAALDAVPAQGVELGAASLVAGKQVVGEPKLMINFARIASGDDVKQVLSDVAEAMAPQVDEARRGVRSNAATQEAADALGLTVEQLLSRRAGQAMNAEESLAARKLWAASGEKLLEVAKKAAEPNAGPVDLYNFRKMLAVHHAIQSEVLAARAEAARALQQWSIPAGGGVEQARNIKLLIDGMGGEAVSGELARRLAFLADQGAPQAAIDAAARKGWQAATMDAVKEAYVAGLLWSPTTHIVNIASNTGVALMQIYERAAARGVSRLAGRDVGDMGVAEGEALALMYGLTRGIPEAFKLGWMALKTGEPVTMAAAKTVDQANVNAISSDAFGIASASGFGRTVDVIGHATRVPYRLLGAEDEFFKTIGYRMEVHAQALRQAASEGLQGKEAWSRMREIVNDPPEHIRIAAVDAATYQTFTGAPGEFVQAMIRLRNAGDFNPLFVITPFLKTPGNILRYTFERTPIAPLVGQWRADVAAGGARADIALARMATGSAIMAWAADMAYSGFISGSGPKNAGEREALQRQGWQPNSIYIGGRWYSFQRSDPYGMMLGFAATLAEQARYAEISPDDFDDWQEVSAAAIAAVGRQVLDKTYFQGVAGLMAAMEDPQRFAPQEINKIITGFVPGSSALRFAERAIDPTEREANDPWQAVQAMIPGLSEGLTPKRDLWGKAKAPQDVYGPVYDLLSPVKVTEVKDSPIDAEMGILGMRTERIKKKTSVKGVDIDLKPYPEVYDAYVRLAGNELKHPVWGMGAKDLLDKIVTGQHELSEAYRVGSGGREGGRADFITRTIQEYRQLAADEVLRNPDFGAFRAEWNRRYLEAQQKKVPVDAQGQPAFRLPELPVTVR